MSDKISKRGRPAKYPMPEPFNAMPERVAKAVLFTTLNFENTVKIS